MMKTLCGTGEETILPNRQDKRRRESFSSLKVQFRSPCIAEIEVEPLSQLLFLFFFLKKITTVNTPALNQNFFHLKKMPTNYCVCASDIIILSLYTSVYCFLN